VDAMLRFIFGSTENAIRLVSETIMQESRSCKMTAVQFWYRRK
jgi:hypothetical protein